MAKKKPKSIETEAVPSTVQVLETGTEEKFDGETEVETTTAVFEDVEEVEGDSERGAHRAVFAEGEPRAAEPGGQGGTADEG